MSIDINIKTDWKEILKDEFQKPYFLETLKLLNIEYENHTIYPKKELIFNALNLTPFSDTKVVILGQDPYHNPNQAMGLSFSVQDGIKVPPSLVNIYKELFNDLNIPVSKSGNLTNWAKQGVLLLNTVLTVRENTPNSHKNIGWAIFTDAIIKKLNEHDKPIVFILWGNNSIKKKDLITNKKHLILTAAHPSPLSANRGFFGCKHFSKTNDFLIENHLSPIDWEIK